MEWCLVSPALVYRPKVFSSVLELDRGMYAIEYGLRFPSAEPVATWLISEGKL